MSTSLVTYELAAHPRPVAPARKRPGLFARILARMIESRRRQAMEELRRHGLRLPRELEDAGLKISARNEDSLPFVR
jgi:hypothetical protein